MRLRIPILPPYKVPIEGRHDGIRCTLLDVLPLPLAYTSATSVGQNCPPSFPELGKDPIPLQSSSYLLRSRSYQQLSLQWERSFASLVQEGSGSGEIFVRRIRTRADERRRDLSRPGRVGVDLFLKSPDWGR